MKISLTQIKKLREISGAGVVAVKKALESAGGKEKQALEIIKKQGLARVKKRADKQTSAGQVYAYIHPGGRIGAMVAVYCETDFVVKSAEFQLLCKELAMQIASMEPKSAKDLLAQAYIREPQKTVADLINELSAKVKEKIVVREFVRFAVQ